jgi:hypothetical protein
MQSSCACCSARTAGDERVYTQAFAGCFGDNDQLRREFAQAIAARWLMRRRCCLAMLPAGACALALADGTCVGVG